MIKYNTHIGKKKRRTVEEQKEMEYTHVTHTFGPVYNENSKVLILGSFPSVKSREVNFYYGHPQNRFWKVLATVYETEEPQTIEEKKTFLLQHNLALWDVIESCDIEGSSDSSIRNVRANDMSVVLRRAPIEKILCNGVKSYELFRKYCRVRERLPIRKMPSTSPANAAWRIGRLAEIWGEEL